MLSLGIGCRDEMARWVKVFLDLKEGAPISSKLSDFAVLGGMESRRAMDYLKGTVNVRCCFLTFSYRPTLPVWYIAQELEFDATDDCVAFLTDLGVVLDPAYQSMDCKLSVSKLL